RPNEEADQCRGERLCQLRRGALRAPRRTAVLRRAAERAEGARDDREEEEEPRNPELRANLDEAVVCSVPSHADSELLALGVGRQHSLGRREISRPDAEDRILEHVPDAALPDLKPPGFLGPV